LQRKAWLVHQLEKIQDTAMVPKHFLPAFYKKEEYMMVI